LEAIEVDIRSKKETIEAQQLAVRDLAGEEKAFADQLIMLNEQAVALRAKYDELMRPLYDEFKGEHLFVCVFICFS
jgi:hypothetical protein